MCVLYTSQTIATVMVYTYRKVVIGLSHTHINIMELGPTSNYQ